MSDLIPEGYTEKCNPECFEFGRNVGCPVWTHGDEPEVCIPERPKDGDGELAYVRSRQRPKDRMGLIDGGLPLDTLQKIAARWGGMVVIPSS